MRDDLPGPAFRLLSTLPVRTHEWTPKKAAPYVVPEWKIEQARALDKTMSRREISAHLGIGRATLNRHLGPAKSGRRRGSKNVRWVKR